MSRRLPPLNGIRVFEAAARHLNFSRAAEELGVTQAAVSHQAKALEQHLGVSLFHRRKRRLYLSEAGQTLSAGAREALDRIEEAVTRVHARAGSGVLTVSVLPSFAGGWLVLRLPRFSERHPEIDVRISASIEMIDFNRDDVDIAVRYGPGNWRGGLRVDRLMTEDIFPVCSPKLLTQGPPLNQPDDLRRHVLLHDDMREDWPMWLLAAGAKGVDPGRGPRFNASDVVFRAAASGQGVALGRSVLVEPYLESGELVRPFEVSLPAQYAYYVVSPGELADRAKIRAFRDWVLEEAAAFMARAANPPVGFSA